MQYISNSDNDKKAMLDVIGVNSFEDILSKIPKHLRNFEWRIPKGQSELEWVRELAEAGQKNENFHKAACYLGAGNYDHFVPAVVSHLAHRGEFITAYTPYQAEASQGTLQCMYEYQSLICELTGMDVSNGSMYDGASALAEAALLAIRLGGKKKILLPSTVHPEYQEVLRTYLSCLDAQIINIPAQGGRIDLAFLEKSADADTAAIIVQQPNFFGTLEEVQKISTIVKKAQTLLIACVNPISLGIIAPPGEYGADVAVGEGQPLGNPVAFGGPHFGFFAVKDELLRKIPGRIVGATVDKHGRRAFVLTLQAREQHIRREKATSNICTNHALCALKGAIYMTLLGRQGIKKIALLNWENAHTTYERLLKVKGVKEFSKAPFFNEFVVLIDKDENRLKKNLKENRILGPLALKRFYPEMKNTYLVAVTENRTAGDLERLVHAIEVS